MPDSSRPTLPVPTGAPPPTPDPAPWKRAVFGSLLAASLLVIAVGLAQDLHSEATHYLYGWVEPIPAAEPEPAASPAPSVPAADEALHPDLLYGDYFGDAVPAARDTSSLVYQFQDLLELFQKRQGIDDNFTMRVIDNRSGELLELRTLAEARAAYRRGEPINWRAIDRQRRRMTRQLVDRYETRGVSREAITIKWGRANQVLEAHARNAPFVEYETRLARYLDFSLLPTQIGTVETFNQDHLVSQVGARGRYQMMPWILRRSGIHQYRLMTASGTRVPVREELHPLLTMEPAFLLMRGYANAVGHEIPGLSAYHTGPGNIYKVFRLFLTEADNRFSPSASVMDAYMWAVTEGYDLVSSQSTFGPYSRGYIASAYGALRATDARSLDRTKTLRAARVQVERGTTLMLADLLDALKGTALHWGPRSDPSATHYERFRALNPHFDLPVSDGDALPSGANVRFVASVRGKAVRFFLPLGAPEALAQAGIDALDEDATFRFDASTYRRPEGAQTKWDRAYDALVHDIRRFGFTEANRDQLLALHERFEALATANPTRYRQRQLQIIETHRRIWMSNPWEHLAEVATRATGRRPMPIEPPVMLHPDPSSITVHPK